MDRRPRGYLVLSMVVFGTVALIMLGGLVSLGLFESKAQQQRSRSEQVFQIAEAGANYYRWHLAHAPSDYQDGTGGAGPYVHDFKDASGTTIGQYSLVITPPSPGSNQVVVDSTGYLLSNPQHRRTVRVRFAIPSLVKYAVVSNDNMRYGAGTEVFGEIHSNGGTRFDGVAHNVVKSSKTCYDDPDTSGGGSCERPGVWTSISPESGVFLAGNEFPVPAVDFVGMSADLADLKAKAQTAGHYFAPSGELGYHIILKANDTFDIYTVDRVRSRCGTPPSWTIRSGYETFVGNYSFPDNGAIFVEDDLWIDGTLDSARLTIGAGLFPSSPSTDKSIIINRDLVYVHNDGQEVLGLLAQKDVNVGQEPENDLIIHGALVAINGRVGRPYYSSSCNPYHVRNSITLYGMIATYGRYGFAYTDGTGYQTRNITYDANLLYNPPPEFPLASDQYTLIDWQEVRP